MKIEQQSLLFSFAVMALALPNPQSAPDLSTLPTCAQTVALQAASSTGCVLTDAECFCKNTGFIQALQQAITSGCSGAAQTSACAWGNQACAAFGVTLPCDASAQSSASDVVASASVIDTAAAASTTSNVGSISSMSMTMTSTSSMRPLGTGSSTSMMTNNGTWTSPTTTGGPAQFTGAAGAAVNTYPGFLSMVAGIALIFAFF